MVSYVSECQPEKAVVSMFRTSGIRTRNVSGDINLLHK